MESIAEAESRIKLLKKDMIDIVSYAEACLEEAKQKERFLKRVNLKAKEAAAILGYTNTHSFYNLVDSLKKKGWLEDGYPYEQIMQMREWKHKHGSLTDLPHKQNFNSQIKHT